MNVQTCTGGVSLTTTGLNGLHTWHAYVNVTFTSFLKCMVLCPLKSHILLMSVLCVFMCIRTDLSQICDPKSPFSFVSLCKDNFSFFSDLLVTVHPAGGPLRKYMYPCSSHRHPCVSPQFLDLTHVSLLMECLSVMFQYTRQGLPFRLALLWPSKEESSLWARGGCRGAWVRRTMRGERQTLMVESSLADSRSSWSAGLKATELTTSSCCRRARQIL